MPEKDIIKILTSIKPEERSPEATINPKPNKKEKKIRPMRQSLKGRASPAERLYKNTAVACALLLCIMGLKNIDSPVTNRLTGALQKAVSMDMNLESSIGQLSFVQKMVPEAALVFLNLSPDENRTSPVEGEVLHAYSPKEPWTEYKSADHSDVYALKSGVAETCVQTDEGDYTLLIAHDDQTKSLYAFLSTVLVSEGDRVSAGSPVGITGEGGQARLYFEYRSGDAVIDPSVLFEE